MNSGPHGRSTGLSAAGRSTTSSRCRPACPSRRSMQTSNLNTGTGSQFPNRIASGELPSRERTIDRWFDVSAFVAPAQFTFGNSGRNILRGPGTKQIDLSLFKSFPVPERRRVEFRAEAFNVLNTPQFNNPNASIGFSRGRAHHQRGQPDGVSAHVAANPTGSQGVFLAMMLFMPPPPTPVSFSRDIAPIMAMYCNACHGESGGISTRSYKELMLGGDLGTVVIPGDPDRSLLIHFLEGRRGENRRMPKNGRALSPHQIEIIRRWIAEGARMTIFRRTFIESNCRLSRCGNRTSRVSSAGSIRKRISC